MIELINSGCLKAVNGLGMFDCIFADPPDNIGVPYGFYSDNLPKSEYIDWLERCINTFSLHTNIIWLSFNSKWIFDVGGIVRDFLCRRSTWEGKSCVQVFTFGQYKNEDLCNNHRPLWRLMKSGTVLYPDQVLELSWRQLHNDKRAKPEGRVPGDVFDFPRVTGNSRQRRSWHPTQLHEGLVQRCILLSTKEGGRVLDPFAGTGTTIRVCKRIKRSCTAIEIDRGYCNLIANEHDLKIKVIV